MRAVRPSTTSGSLYCFAKSSAVRPIWFFTFRSAPLSSSSLTVDTWPPRAAIISGVVPFGEPASMYAS